jgi:transcriptional regulator with XRE-family HTH domain
MTNSLGQWLKERCEAEGLSLRQAAARIGVSHGTIAKIIEGASPSPQTIRRLVRAFAVQNAERLVLEDRLLVLAGYRTPREDEEVSCRPGSSDRMKLDESKVTGR